MKYELEITNKFKKDLKLCQKNIYEPEMIELVKTTIKKLEKITDEEFTEIGYFIADNFYDFYEE